MKKKTLSLEEKVLKTNKKYKLFELGDKILVAVSGGADSIALLHCLTKLKDSFDLKLHIFHLDHKMRKDSWRDASFVEKQARKYGLPATIVSSDVVKYIKDKGLSRQEGARKVRYELLQKTASETKAKKIALGHQADDQIETFLMRLIRGAGLKGLQGIPPKRENIIRPLIEITRSEIEEYLKENNLQFRLDPSNLSPDYLRTKVRQQLLPLLKETNPNISLVLLQTIGLITTDQKFLENLAQKELKNIFGKGEISLKIPLNKLSKYPLALRRRMLRHTITQIKGNLRQIEFKHVEKILKKIEKQEKFQLDLPGNLVVFREYDNLVITTKEYLEHHKMPKAKLKVPGVTKLDSWGIEIVAKYLDPKNSDLKGLNIARGKNWCYLDGDKVRLPLLLRQWEPGDRFVPLGMKKGKKLQDFFVDEKVPKMMRRKIPIIHTEQQILWVVGYRIDNRVKIGLKTKKILQLEIKKD